MEFLVRHEFNFPDGVDREKVIAEERARVAELAREGKALRIWRDPLQSATWSLWNFKDVDELQSAFSALPAYPYFQNITVRALGSHPADPRRAP